MIDNNTYNKYNILVFISGRTDKGSIEWNINKWYGYNYSITYINTDYLLAGLMNNSELQKIVDNFRLNYYGSIYITTQKKRTRQAIRQLFKKQYEVDLHIKTYAKLVENVKRIIMRK